MKHFSFLVIVIFCLLFLPLWAQKSIINVSTIEQEIQNNQLEKAEQSLNTNLRYWQSKENIDSLIDYIPLKGKIAYKQYGVKEATAAVYQYIAILEKMDISPLQTIHAYQKATEYFSQISQLKESYHSTMMALKHAEQLVVDKGEIIAQCHYNLGSLSGKMGNLELSKIHHLKAMEYRQSLKNGNPEDLYLSFNAIGGLYWYASIYDSAVYCFNESLNYLNQMPPNSLNRYYRAAIIKNNLSALYHSEGENTKAIETMKSVIEDFQTFIHIDSFETKKTYAQQNWFEAIDNLAGIYREVGDYNQAGNLLNYAYQQKKQRLGKSYYGIFISEILLGQLYQQTGAQEEAKKFLDMGLAHLEKADGDFSYWAADAWYSLALLHEKQKQNKIAAQCYETSELLYEKAYAGVYDNIYMDFLRNFSLFYASQNEYEKAMEKSEKVYHYLKTVGSDQKLPGFYQLLNLAEINYLTQHYQKAIKYTDAAFALLAKQFNGAKSPMDSVKINFFKPKAILINAKSRYALQTKKDSAFLFQVYQVLDTAIQILESRKKLIDDPKNINFLMAEQKDLIDFYAKINLELYEQNRRDQYLEQFIHLKESALYGRIRNRLNQENSISYSRVPPEIVKEEREIKLSIQNILENPKPNTHQFHDYVHATESWEQFLIQIKEKYPRYYQLRFATLFQSIPKLNSLVPENTTIVRYYFMDTSLVALLLNQQNIQVIHLNSKDLEDKVTTYLTQQLNEKTQLNLLHQIYNQIWAPFDDRLLTKKIIIIPDGILYNLSLDMLPFKSIQQFSQLYYKSLLSKYSFTYNYSLFMMENKPEKIKTKNNLVAFAPGFSDELKGKYTSALEDSMNMDRIYLNLLPQPTSSRLTKEIKSQLGGKIFVNEASTVSNFKENANNNKIIFLATHAKYNNSLPEQSGLYFAKTNHNQEDNFLSLKEIYDCELNADLMVLTACESGKPGYNDGEGLVSLANAVNYSGSKSILTGLWEIDEQSTAEITKEFIKKVTEGLSTDEALRQAKLTYLKNNEGRILAPAYWSGLVLIGHPELLELTTVSQNKYWMFLTATGVLLLILLLIYQKKTKGEVF